MLPVVVHSPPHALWLRPQALAVALVVAEGPNGKSHRSLSGEVATMQVWGVGDRALPSRQACR